ncbi:MMPL family transporter, partial [Mammaliicoccus sciuri]|uniref:MMPL family transporter n=1 Tax=Mammaliicoccus sciuri TaxID=1296 RepID=UPI0022706D8C
LKESGPVIVAAALIMFSVFISFVFQDDVMIKSMGIALAFGVLFDAFIVRMTIIPALTKLFGRASWYIPNWLNSILPKIDIEGHALSENNQVAEETDTDNTNATTIEVSPKTKAIYDKIDETNKDEVLYEALRQHRNKQENNTQDDIKTNKDNQEIVEILNRQTKNIEQVNQLVERLINKK